MNEYNELNAAYYAETGLTLPLQCWLVHPWDNPIFNVILQNECLTIPIEVFKIFGYYKYAPEVEVDKLLAMNKEVLELSENL